MGSKQSVTLVAAGMQAASKILAPLLLLVATIGCTTTQPDEPTARAVQFLTNVYTGKMMNAEEWLTRQARSEPAFNSHGGLDSMVKQSTARAERYGGLKSVRVLQSTKTEEQIDVKIIILFHQDPSASPDVPNAAKEEMIWNMTAAKEDGNWKLSF